MNIDENIYLAEANLEQFLESRLCGYLFLKHWVLPFIQKNSERAVHNTLKFPNANQDEQNRKFVKDAMRREDDDGVQDEKTLGKDDAEIPPEPSSLELKVQERLRIGVHATTNNAAGT